MSQQTINVGAAPNDGTGTPLRTAFQYTNSNFTELYTAVGPSGNNIVVPGNATITGDLTVDTSTLKVDSANNRVGINNASPTTDLDITGSTKISGTIAVGTGANSAVQKAAFLGGYTVFENSAGTGNPSITFNNDTDTGFFNAGANIIGFATGGSERMRIDSSGNVGVGVTPNTWTAYKALQINTVSAIGGSSGSTDVGLNWYYNGGNKYIGNGYASSYIQYNGTHIFNIAANNVSGAGAALTWTQAMTLDASGRLLVGPTSANTSGGVLQLSSGITFPATQVASSDANTLDDYEEGTWTPTVGDASSGGNQGTTATAVGRYTKIGRLVTVQFELTDIDTTGLTAGNSLYIRGLPFTASSATTQYGTITGAGITFSGFLTCGVYNSTAFPIYQTSSGGSLADIKVSGFASGTADIWGTLTYIV